MQQRVLDVLLECYRHQLAVEASELKHLASLGLPSVGRSNLRRAVRALVRRNLVHEWAEGGGRYYELAFVGWIRALPLARGDPACCRLTGIPHESREHEADRKESR